MTHVTVSDRLKTQLGASGEPLVLCDEAGNPLGTFTPLNRLTEQQRIAMTLPDHLRDSKVPVEELRRRLRDEPRIPHEEVMETLRRYL
jgi:hypothetical protein